MNLQLPTYHPVEAVAHGSDMVTKTVKPSVSGFGEVITGFPKSKTFRQVEGIERPNEEAEPAGKEIEGTVETESRAPTPVNKIPVSGKKEFLPVVIPGMKELIDLQTSRRFSEFGAHWRVGREKTQVSSTQPANTRRGKLRATGVGEVKKTSARIPVGDRGDERIERNVVDPGTKTGGRKDGFEEASNLKELKPDRGTPVKSPLLETGNRSEGSESLKEASKPENGSRQVGKIGVGEDTEQLRGPTGIKHQVGQAPRKSTVIITQEAGIGKGTQGDTGKNRKESQPVRFETDENNGKTEARDTSRPAGPAAVKTATIDHAKIKQPNREFTMQALTGTGEMRRFDGDTTAVETLSRLARASVFREITQVVHQMTAGQITQTQVTIDGGRLGEVEVHYSGDKAHKQITIVVETDAARETIWKLHRSISESLIGKGIDLSQLNVEVRNFERDGRHLRQANHGRRGLRRVENESHRETPAIARPGARDFGYNTMEIIA